MANDRTESAVELFPRRVFIGGLGAIGATFVLPGCGSAPAKDASTASSVPPEASAATAATPGSSVPRNEAWEAEAKSLESGGQGLYTAKDPKDQPTKAGSHVPKVLLTGDKVSLSTTHPTEAPSTEKPKGHHITHHYLRDTSSGVIFAWKTFDLKPGETAASDFSVPAGVTSFTAYQVCNLHWTWAAEPQAKA